MIYCWLNDKWEKQPGKASFIECGSSVWVLNNGTPYKWVDNKWSKQVGSNFSSIMVGEDETVWAITTNNEIKSFEGDSWISIEGNFKEISIANNKFIWAIDESGKLFKFEEGKWEEKPNPHNVIKISTCDKYVAGNDESGNLFLFYDVLYLPGWNNVSPKQYQIKQLDVGRRNQAWAITENNEVIYFNEKENTWEITDSGMQSISCSSGEVWAVDVDGRIYHRSGDEWTRKPGNVRKLSVGGVNVWAISSQGFTFCWNGNN